MLSSSSKNKLEPEIISRQENNAIQRTINYLGKQLALLDDELAEDDLIGFHGDYIKTN